MPTFYEFIDHQPNDDHQQEQPFSLFKDLTVILCCYSDTKLQLTH